MSEKLEALQGMAQEADAMGAPTAEQQAEAAAQVQQVQAADAAEIEAQKWAAIPLMIGGALAMFAPELRQVYTPDNCLTWGRAVVPVAEKYGWTGAGALPELSLALATFSIAAPTFIVIKHRLDNPDAPAAGGVVVAVRTWWRNLRAKRTAAIVKDATDKAQEGAAGGSQ